MPLPLTFGAIRVLRRCRKVTSVKGCQRLLQTLKRLCRAAGDQKGTENSCGKENGENSGADIKVLHLTSSLRTR